MRRKRDYAPVELSQQREQKRLLAVQPVLGLIEDHRHRRLEDVGRDFFVTVGRQAVHERGAIARMPHHRHGHLIAVECALPLRGFGFLSHRRPDVGVDGVGTSDRLDGIAEQADLRPMTRHLHRLLDHARRQLVALGRCDVKRRAQHDARRAPATWRRCFRRRQTPPCGRPFAPDLLQRLQVGERLAGMLGVAQRIHHVQPRRGLCELEQRRVMRRCA